MMTIEAKIRKVRAHMSHGFHDPSIMEDIACLSDVLKICISFENLIMDANMDID